MASASAMSTSSTSASAASNEAAKDGTGTDSSSSSDSEETNERSHVHATATASEHGSHSQGLLKKHRYSTRSSCKVFTPSVLLTNKPTFEALIDLSWHIVEVLPSVETKPGFIRVQLIENPTYYEVDRRLVRLRSRNTTNGDCLKLEPGADICIYSRSEDANSRQAWRDGRISQIERSHKQQVEHSQVSCTCRFIVHLYQSGDIWGDILVPCERRLKITNIRILQGPCKPLSNLLEIEEEEDLQQWSYDTFSLKNQGMVQAELREEVIRDAFADMETDGSESTDDWSAFADMETDRSDRRSKCRRRVGKKAVHDSSSESSSSVEADTETLDPLQEDLADFACFLETNIARKKNGKASTSNGKATSSGKASKSGSKSGNKKKSQSKVESNEDRCESRKNSTSTNKSRIPASINRAAAFTDRSQPFTNRSRKRREANFVAWDPVDEERLEKEQGYVVSLARYWNRHAIQAEEERKEAAKNRIEHEDLWRQMDEFLDLYMSKKKECGATETQQCGPEGLCEVHDYEVDEEVGMICSACGYIAIHADKMAPCPTAGAFRLWETQNKEDGDGDGASSCEDDGPLEHPGGSAQFMRLKKYEDEMYPHQDQALRFMWRNLIDEKGGCILAHSPGTGKSFTSIAFYDMFRRTFPASCRLLILAPKAMMSAWQAEFHKWNVEVYVYILSSEMRAEQKKEALLGWIRNRGVLIAGYGLFVSMASDEHIKKKKKSFQKLLLEGPDLMFLDEGHYLRTRKTNVRLTLSKVKTKLRILLSGTLFQNNFEELFNVYYLVRPDFITRMEDWAQLKEAVYGDYDYDDEKEEDRARKLFVRQIGDKFGKKEHKLLQEEARDKLLALTRSFTDHYKGEILNKLPGLFDYSVRLRLSPVQRKLYARCKQVPQLSLELELSVTYISIHPYLFSKLGFKDKVADVLETVEALNMDREAGVKMKFVLDVIQNTSEKVLVFSEQRAPLTMLGEMLHSEFGWCSDKEVLKLDGSSSLSERQDVISRFNSESDQSRVCLASIKACAEGITLTGASRVVFLHTVWNASQMNQAISRAFRIGQTKKVFVYRLVADIPEELNKYSRTGWKDWVANNIFDSRECDTADACTTNRPAESYTSTMEEALAEDSLLCKLKNNDSDGTIQDVIKHKEFLSRQQDAGELAQI